ncbi:MAG: hypothetical protein M1114_02735 [Candidatus Dependentiae bacterium]|nr:hypothetical protein [Candidatus Dependentiae bacterium]
MSIIFQLQFIKSVIQSLGEAWWSKPDDTSNFILEETLLLSIRQLLLQH